MQEKWNMSMTKTDEWKEYFQKLLQENNEEIQIQENNEEIQMSIKGMKR